MKIARAMLLGFLIVVGGFWMVPRVEASPEDFGSQSYEEVLRADLRAKHAVLINKVMQFTGKEAEAFWSIFWDYEKDLMKLNDGKVKILKEYIQSYKNLSEEKTYELAEGALDFEAGRVKLKRYYFRKFSKALSPQTAVKFFQVENHIQALVDLQIASEVPLVK